MLVCGIFPLVLCAQEVSPDKVLKSKQKPEAAAEEQVPPEEDESFVKKEYTFNPLQATTELRIGNYYFKKGNYRAAAQRFTEATKWDPGLAEAYLRLGEAKEKQKDPKAAREAFAKYLEVSPDAKNAADVKKRMDKTKSNK